MKEGDVGHEGVAAEHVEGVTVQGNGFFAFFALGGDIRNDIQMRWRKIGKKVRSDSQELMEGREKKRRLDCQKTDFERK